MKNSNHSDLIDLEEYSFLCLTNDLKENEGKRFIINDVDIAVFKVSDIIYALSNICPHQHTSTIYDGFIEDGCVVCPVHGWMFNLKTGFMPNKKSGLLVYCVKIIDENVYVKAEKDTYSW